METPSLNRPKEDEIFRGYIDMDMVRPVKAQSHVDVGHKMHSLAMKNLANQALCDELLYQYSVLWSEDWNTSREVGHFQVQVTNADDGSYRTVNYKKASDKPSAPLVQLLRKEGLIPQDKEFENLGKISEFLLKKDVSAKLQQQ